MSLILILSRPFNIQGAEPYLCDFIKLNLRGLVFRHLQIDFFQTWYEVRDHYVLHFNISLDDFEFIQDDSCI